MPNSHRTLCLESNNSSSDISNRVVAKRDLAALGPLLLIGRCCKSWREAPLPYLAQNPLDQLRIWGAGSESGHPAEKISHHTN